MYERDDTMYSCMVVFIGCVRVLKIGGGPKIESVGIIRLWANLQRWYDVTVPARAGNNTRIRDDTTADVVGSGVAATAFVAAVAVVIVVVAIDIAVIVVAAAAVVAVAVATSYFTIKMIVRKIALAALALPLSLSLL